MKRFTVLMYVYLCMYAVIFLQSFFCLLVTNLLIILVIVMRGKPGSLKIIQPEFAFFGPFELVFVYMYMQAYMCRSVYICMYELINVFFSNYFLKFFFIVTFTVFNFFFFLIKFTNNTFKFHF